MSTFFRAGLYYGLLILSLVICVGWHGLLFSTPTDTLTGSADFRGGQYHLNYFAPPGSPWSDNGVATYQVILRVDARDVTEWLARAIQPNKDWPTDWEIGSSHQYLVERRDGDGKRVINTQMRLPRATQLPHHLALALLAVAGSVIAAMAISLQKPRPDISVPLMFMACGGLLNLSWLTLGVPFSYVALRVPFFIQIALHVVAGILYTGAVVHTALTFPVPLVWYTHRRWLVLATLYGAYPAGLLFIILMQPTLVDKFVGFFEWEQQITVTLKAAAYMIWAAQYRRASVSQRGQMHWILIVIAAYDLVYMAQIFSRSPKFIQPQLWLSLLLPAGYVMAVLPRRSLRLTLGPISGFIHGVATTLTLALFLSGLGLAASLLTPWKNATALPVMTILLSILFALTTVPLANLLREQFDSWFHGTRSAQRALLHQFTDRVSQHITLSEVTRVFYETLDQGVQPSDKALWLWNDETQALQPIGASGVFIPVDRARYEQLLALRVFTPVEQINPWQELQGYLGLISLIASRKLVGVCAIGTRVDGRGYPGDVIRFFETLTRSATLGFHNARLVEQLEDKIIALRQAYQQHINVQESERRRLAAELHDETLQQLAHLNLLAGGLQECIAGASAETLLQELQATLLSTERHLREILRGVHPVVLTDLGLIPALLSWLPRPPGILVELTAAGFEGKRLPDAMLELTLYRLCQESVNNALKHAHARRIDLKLIWKKDTVILEVADDGVGFEPAALASKHRAENGHFGLTNLRERVNALNGQLVIRSQPNCGTTIQAVLPLQAEASHVNRGEQYGQ
ncbi:MAG: sensor histidine kinase [Anaerolineae bacterium]|nr:sensor histidine kinase [Anaerolineae bacterium]